MNSLPVKHHWLDRAIQVYNFHIRQIKDEKNWTLEKTAKALNRSTGSVSYDIKVAEWSKTHEKQLRRCSSLRDALDWIKDKKKDMMREI